ncbi:hypothetical protein H6F38_23065 [Paenibacillus sp. EKM208P]|nr:hypothetical protein H6F38_23065 [Paenibacillus sp. EKM208P]
MTTANNFSELEKLIKQKLTSSLQIEVSNKIKETMKNKIQSDVYDVYDPTLYKRQKEQGGLIDKRNMIVNMVNQSTVSVESRRMDGSVNVGQVVETGKGYRYEFAYSNKPRPFVEKTVEELRNTNSHITALYNGLIRQGLNVEIK